MSQHQPSRSEIEINEDKLYQEESCARDRWSTVGLADAFILTDKGMEKETCVWLREEPQGPGPTWQPPLVRMRKNERIARRSAP